MPAMSRRRGFSLTVLVLLCAQPAQADWPSQPGDDLYAWETDGKADGIVR